MRATPAAIQQKYRKGTPSDWFFGRVCPIKTYAAFFLSLNAETDI